jgi:hypothetical protein
MAAAVAATTVEPATTTAMESVAAVKAPVVTATVKAAMITVTTVSMVAAVAVIAMSIVAAAIIAVAVIAATVDAVAIVAAVEPRAGADEDAAGKVVRSIVAVWSAGVRIVAVVAVGADRRSTVDGTYPNSDAKPYLRVGAARGEK